MKTADTRQAYFEFQDEPTGSGTPVPCSVRLPSVSSTPLPPDFEKNHTKSATLEGLFSNEIAKYTDAGFRFKGGDFRKMCGPQVYLLIRNDRALYVGMSAKGISRVSDPEHAQAERARKLCNEVLIYPCKTKGDAAKLEQILIAAFQPQYNIKGKNYTLMPSTMVGRPEKLIRTRIPETIQ